MVEVIKKGAYLCTGAEDIFAAFGMEIEEKQAVSLTAGEARVLAAATGPATASWRLALACAGFTDLPAADCSA